MTAIEWTDWPEDLRLRELPTRCPAASTRPQTPTTATEGRTLMHERLTASTIFVPASGPGSRPRSQACDTGLLTLPLLAPGLELPELPGALCKGQDPSPWFPPPGTSYQKGKEVCRVCPAQRQCLQWAIQADERAGVWGGTSPDERALIRRDQMPALSSGGMRPVVWTESTAVATPGRDGRA